MQNASGQTDNAFFARLGAAFAVAIAVCGVMMLTVGPVSPELSEGAQITTEIASLSASNGR